MASFPHDKHKPEEPEGKLNGGPATSANPYLQPPKKSSQYGSSVGHHDLHPQFPGQPGGGPPLGGGSQVGPNHPIFQGDARHGNNPYPNPPEGARFDPFGPVDPHGVHDPHNCKPKNRFANPDNDELKPPHMRDHFM